jgi:Ca-activated chloride channel family protein
MQLFRVADVMAKSRPAPRESFSVFLNPTRRKRNLRNGHLFLAPSLLLLGILGFSASLTPQHSPGHVDSQAKIALSVNLVQLPVNVTDAHGTSITGLKPDDFRVLEDGQLQKITVFDEGHTPVTAGLVVDHSRSMGPKLRDVVAAVYTFAHSSNPQDEMFVVDFNDDVTIELMHGKAFSSNPKDLEEALNAVTARGRTVLYDAVSEGLHHLRYARWSKKALIIISDGGDNASHLKYSQVLAQARQSRSLIYSIVLVGSEDTEENPGLLRRLCKDTGGIAYFPGEGESVASVSARIARDLREQYMLGYVPQNVERAVAFRKIEVKVTAPGHPGLRVRTRQGYSPAAEKQPTAQLASGTR